jgi:SAM-dependent methyltransferase
MTKYGFVHPLSQFETFNVARYSCPACDANDRDRLCAVYLGKEFRKLDRGRKHTFVDFGASPPLSRWIMEHPFIHYRTADLYRRNVDDRVDITNMAAYPDGSIDMFLCSHVLEHISEDRKAIRELCRILNPGGFGMLLAPIILSLRETHEDNGDLPAEDRWRFFGQDDHLRIYSRSDFIDRLKEGGFTVDQYGIGEFGQEAFRLHGIHENSTLYVVGK